MAQLFPFSHAFIFCVCFFLPFFFLLYSMVTQLHIHVCILFSHFILFHHKCLDIAPSATEQDLIANPFRRQQSASIYPRLPVHPTLDNHKSVLQVHDFLFCGGVCLCQILDSRYVISYGICPMPLEANKLNHKYYGKQGKYILI